jgi:ATP-dependent Clp protease protease subunit
MSMRDAIEAIHEHDIAFVNRTLYLLGEIDDDMLAKLAKNLNLLQQRGSTNPINIVLNSGGGCVQSALSMYDLIQNSECHITITVMGEAASSACLVLQAADLRRAYKRSTIMWHGGTDSQPELPTGEYRSAFNHSWVLEKFAYDIVYSRMKQANPKLKPSQYLKKVASGIYLAAEAAVVEGLIDEVIV